MSSRFFRLRWSRACLVAAIAAVACSRAQPDEYVLGAAGPWTRAFGQMNRRGMELAAAEVNGQGGINGVKLRIDFQDDSGEGSRAVAIAQRFVDAPEVSAVIGHVTSGAMQAAAKVYDGRMPAVATTASSASLSGISSWTFRVISSDSVNGAEIARSATAMGHRRVSILYENDNYGRGLASAFRDAFAGDVVSMDPIASTLPNAEPYIAYFRQRRPDLVFVAGTEASGMTLLREAHRQSFTAQFMGGDGWTGVVGDSASDGALVGAPFSPDDERPAARTFVETFRTQYGMEPDGNAAMGYDATKLLAAALAAAGPNRRRVRDWLTNLDETTAFRGVTGSIRFNAAGDPIGRTIVLTRVRAGKLIMERAR